ncbi:DUF4843 domain-containing protein [Chitinophaga sp. 212800010-3]|uniref:DUF4843 domain-containing protein n=1 Tax=unclassified Chitinophaga TaxID=2619133 RepID=UPI002DE47DC5|nr:DUF4843 domain-containing protein [Chitinophaga sp. 212800010-3]
MKKWLLHGMVCLMLAACSKSELTVYNDNPRMYFSIASLTYSFATKPSKLEKDTIAFRLNYSGMTLKSPLAARISVVKEKSTAVQGTDYELLNNYAMPAGKFFDSLRLVVKRTPGIAVTPVTLVVRLEETESYKAGLNTNGKEITFTISNILVKPDSWESYLVPYFGAYSKTKYRFIIDTLNISDFPWEMTRNGQLLYLKTKLALALAAYEKANGPLVDPETGNTVFFPA